MVAAAPDPRPAADPPAAPTPQSPDPDTSHRDGRVTALLASRPVVTLVIVLGVVARLIQYAAHRSLWHDEAALALNILGRPWLRLAQPLDLQQTAPIGFLWAEKAATTLLGPSEWALRLLPLAAGCGALVLLLLVARRLVRGVAVPLTVGLLAVSTPLIYYSDEAKQYAFDVAIALAILLLALRATDRRTPLSPRAGVMLGLLGAVAPWFSQPAVFALGGAGLYLLLEARARRVRWQSAAPALALWALGSLLAVAQALHAHGAPTRAYLEAFWQPAFLPWWNGAAATLHWLGATTLGEFSWLVADPLAWPAILLATIGLVALLRRPAGVGLAALVLGPTLLALLASALRLYPFATRLTLFVAPAIALLIGCGLDALNSSRAARPNPLATLLAVVTFALAARPLRDLPMVHEELRPMVRYVAAHRQPGDAIYVYYGALPAFRYYAPGSGLGPDAYIAGRCARSAWRSYLAELSSLRGRRRVWLVLSHPFTGMGIREQQLFTDYLGQAGTLLDQRRAPGALAALYDLSDTAQVDAATRAFRPSRVPITAGAREPCDPDGGA